MNIPVVVIAYNRLDSLKRLLSSLNRAIYTLDVKLIISIDGGGDEKVIEYAKQFVWKHGEKELVVHQSNIGLRQHVLSCGSLSKYYDGVILLEDDIYVAPNFYEYVAEAQDFYKDDPNVAGIALYSHLHNETAKLPFIPIDDGYDVYFSTLACSWGQSWSAAQWVGFASWYEKNESMDLRNDATIPPDVRIWPDTSWKKYFIKYLAQNQKYFVYPRISYSTNFGDRGQHHEGTKTFQVPLSVGKKELKFPKLEDSGSRYDVYCELERDCLSFYVEDLKNYDLTVDLFGMKHMSSIDTKYVITRQDCSQAIKSYGLELKPHEMNVIDSIRGSDLVLAETKHMKPYDNFLMHRLAIYGDHINVQPYYFTIEDSHFYFLHEKIRELTRPKISDVQIIVATLLKKVTYKLRALLTKFSTRY